MSWWGQARDTGQRPSVVAGLAFGGVSAYAQNQFDQVVWLVGKEIEDEMHAYANQRDHKNQTPSDRQIRQYYKRLMKIGTGEVDQS